MNRSCRRECSLSGVKRFHAYLRFKGFDEEGLRLALPMIVEEFSRVAAVPREIVNVELLNIT